MWFFYSERYKSYIMISYYYKIYIGVCVFVIFTNLTLTCHRIIGLQWLAPDYIDVFYYNLYDNILFNSQRHIMSNNIHIQDDCGYIIKKSKAYISNRLHGYCMLYVLSLIWCPFITQLHYTYPMAWFFFNSPGTTLSLV